MTYLLLLIFINYLMLKTLIFLITNHGYLNLRYFTILYIALK